MSSDNGIYLVQFKDGWRVNHLQGIDNIHWFAECCSHPFLIPTDLNKEDLCFHEQCKNCGKIDPEFVCKPEFINMQTIYGFFHDSDIYATKEDAMKRADEIYNQITNDDFCGQIEYGIQEIHGLEEFDFPTEYKYEYTED